MIDQMLWDKPIERVDDFEQYDKDNAWIWREFEAQTLWLIG